MKEQKFKFWCPAELTKAKDKDGNEVMKLGGIASTIDKDSDGEFLDPAGFDIEPFKKSGFINYHHGAKSSPASIIGEPSKAELRKEGLYVEASLYPDSKIAKEVWDLAHTLKKNSKTRRLGFSIEGNVIERGSDDKNDPEYYNVKKATISHCAVTFSPKNQKTFADIIKGNVEMSDEDFSEEHEILKKETEQPNKELEELKDKALVIPTTTDKFELYDKIFDHYSGISLQKADEVYKILNHIFKMKKTEINDDKLQKAMDTLGINAEDNTFFAKGKKESSDDVAAKVTKQSMGDDEDEDDDDMEKAPKKEIKKAKGNVADPKAGKNEEKEETDEEEKEEAEKEKPKKEIKKAKSVELEKAEDAPIITEEKKENGFVGKIEKAIETQFGEFFGKIKEQNQALGVMLKKSHEDNELIKGELEEMKTALSKAQETIDSFGNEPNKRKSVTKGVERQFAKGEDSNELSKAGFTVINVSDRQKVLNVLDHCTFEKGLDSEFEKAMLGFEAGSGIPANIISRLKVEKKVIIN